MRWNQSDARVFIQTLTVRKLFNYLKLWSSYWLSKATKRNWHAGQPISISLEPTTTCNLRCPECPSGLRSFTRPTGNLSLDSGKHLIDQLSRELMYLTFYFQGEPFLNPSIYDLIAHAKARNVYTATSTNAHYINPATAKKIVESGLSRLIISIDGTTQEVYEQYRKGGNLQRVLEGTKALVQARKEAGSRTPHLVFQFLVVRPNEHQIEEVHELAEELGVDEVKLKTAQLYDYAHGNPLMPTLNKYSRYRKTSDGTYVPKQSFHNSCWRMWTGSVVTWDGKVVPCCFDKDAHHTLGSVQQIDFRSVWKSAAYRAFRTQVLRARKEIDMCKNCSEGAKVWA